MSAPENKLTERSAVRRGKKTDPPVAQHGSAHDSSTRLRVRGVNVLSDSAVREKEKVSITLDKSLVEQIRSLFGERALSTSINDLLYTALAQERLSELVDEMEKEAGQASREAYEQVLAQWFEGD